jgi:hypothetical protein
VDCCLHYLRAEGGKKEKEEEEEWKGKVGMVSWIDGGNGQREGNSGAV